MYPETFGCFLPPYHDPAQSPGVTLRQDIELCGLADELGFDEMWLGEHHSGGWGTLSAPEMLIAAVARETRRIRFGTGIIPLPYHHPVHTAERIALLDQLTSGRAILGCGTGTYVYDMEMIGVDPTDVRSHFQAALQVVQAMLEGRTVDITTPWFTAKNAVLQFRPYRDRIEVVLASSLSEEAIDLLVGTGTAPIVNLTPPWGAIRPGAEADPLTSLAERMAGYRTKSGGAARIRCNIFVHVADSTARGLDELTAGWTAQRLGLYRTVLGMPMPTAPAVHRKTLESLVEHGAFVVGDAPTCVRMIRDIVDRLGEVDTLTFYVPGWLPHEAVREQLTTIADEVVPGLRGEFDGTAESMRNAAGHAGRRAELRAAMTVKNDAAQV